MWNSVFDGGAGIGRQRLKNQLTAYIYSLQTPESRFGSLITQSLAFRACIELVVQHGPGMTGLESASLIGVKVEQNLLAMFLKRIHPNTYLF